MKLETVAIESLSLDKNNARKHSKRNLDAIAASLNRFGQRKPVVVHNNVVIAGNGTIEAAKSLGWLEVAISRCPDDWDAETAKAYALADNRSSELAEWDDTVLSSQLLELDEMGWDVTEFGFTIANNSVDASAEWNDMPDFDQDNKLSAFHTTVHFPTEKDADDFFKLIDRPKKASFWYPTTDGLIGTDASKQYISEE